MTMTAGVNHLISDGVRECGEEGKKDVRYMEKLMGITKPVSHD